MQPGIGYALLSMFCAGFTSVIAKIGLTGITGDLGLAIRTAFVFLFTMIFAAIVVPIKQLETLTAHNVFWLGLSALTTTASWIFYYRAIKVADVSTVALIDKGSVVVALGLAFWLLHEAITPPKLIGAALIVVGLLVISRG